MYTEEKYLGVLSVYETGFDIQLRTLMETTELTKYAENEWEWISR